MADLNTANASAYGNPEITNVDIGVRKNPAILISGYDLKYLEMLLEQTKDTGVDVYTHSEMLPAHYYPFFKKYPHFAGNYGNAWWKQESDANPKTTSSRDSILVTTEKEAPDPPKQEKTEAVRYIPPEKLELTDAVVPEGQVFSEAMNLLLYLARTYPETFILRLYDPVSASEVTAFEERNGIEMTEELRSLYQFTNGFTWNCGYIHLMELDQVEKHLKNVYEWGDTKHYAYLGERVGDGEGIYFDLDSRKIITNFHGEETEYACLTDILNKIIDEFLDCEVEDDRLDAYLQKLRA